MRKILLAAAFACAAVPFLMATAAAAADYPPACGSLRLGAPSAAPGGTVSQTGSGFAPGSSVQVTLGSSAATTVVDGSGTERSVVEIPSSMDPGIHSIAASGTGPDGGSFHLCGTLTVNGLVRNLPGTRAPGGSLAFTGSDSATLAGIGVAAVIGGILAVRLTQRRPLRKS
jgi:hypothetical protein